MFIGSWLNFRYVGIVCIIIDIKIECRSFMCVIEVFCDYYAMYIIWLSGYLMNIIWRSLKKPYHYSRVRSANRCSLSV